MQQVTFSHARTNFATLWDSVLDNREPVKLTRRGHENVMLISESDYSSMMETIYLLSSPANAERLLFALDRAERREGNVQTLLELQKELGWKDGE